MSRFHEQRYKRWSDSNLHKPCFYCTPTSEEEVPLYASQLLPPLLSITHQCKPFERTSSHYGLCDKQNNGRTKPLSLNESQNLKKLNCLKCQEFEKIRGNLELHLAETQIEETLAEDRQTALMRHLNLSITALEALAQYGQSLQVSQLTACRVLDISHLLALPQPYSTNSEPSTVNLTMHLQQLKVQKENKLMILQDLMEQCSEHIALPKHFNDLMNNNCIRKKDFYKATKNFKNFLSNSILSISQIEKLHQQYGTILSNYQRSRCMLDLELPKLINMRLMALCEGFEKITKVFDNKDGDNEIVAIFKLIGEKLYIKDSNTVAISHVQDSSKPKLCQKCKINYVDDK